MLRYKGKKFSLASKKEKLPNGFWAQYDMIIHPGAALIVPFLGKNKLLMLRQYRPVVQSYLFEFPAGTLSPGESYLQCARRELTEETGYKAQIITALGQIFPVPGYSDEVIYLFKAQKLLLVNSSKDPDEIISVIQLEKRQIKKIFLDGRIKDAKTICALAFCGII